MADSNLLARLASLSMRQLRDVARSLGVSRYSSENREGLADAIATSQDPRRAEEAIEAANLAAIEAEMSPAPRPDSETRVVFLPRDPQWAYVFWDIAGADRDDAMAAGGTQLCAAAPKDHIAASAASMNLVFIVPPESLSSGRASGGRYRRA